MLDFILSHIPSFLWGLTAFVVFVLILLRLALKPVLAALDARDAKIAKDLADAEAANRRAQELKAELERVIRENQDKVGALLAQARREAEQAREALLEKGRAEVEAMRVRALQDIEAARHAAIIELRKEVADIATEVAEKILARHLDAERHAELAQQAIEAYEAARAK
ncbi:MAG: F0F1 ATP synthase subunit B [Planctomycetota bacterium]|nr:F0F1 ATP synthase subunit B [Planctomycetota bacterium]MCX8039786.1 F0F1 ATP synthase subunit B [Planctomycetota bacterium]MDW8373166.1 F0F1 ATP synthase subunit B [Planctomycetota bacterium]